MVQNGYILNVSTADLPAFLQRVRSELKAVTREGVLIQVAKSAEMLYDMKFIEQRKYEASIFEQSLRIVDGRISGVALGAFKDDRLDFRASLIIAKSGEKNKFQYVLLNTENTLIHHYWDELPETQPYKFDATVSEDDPDYEENAAHGRIWHGIFEEAGWNIHLTGYAAQLSVQPRVDEMNITPKELSKYFTDHEMRAGDYVRSSVIIGKVKSLVGNTPIEKINPYTLLDYFRRGINYVETKQGEAEAKKLYEEIKKGFAPIMLDTLTLSE